MIWTIHNRRPHKERDSETFDWFRRELTRVADAIHVHAPHAADHMIRQLSADPRKVQIIPHPSYLGAYEAADVTLARKLPVTAKRKFLFFGMVRKSKGLELLSVAAKRLSTRQQNWELDVVVKVFRRERKIISALDEIDQVATISERVPNNAIPEVFGNKHAFLAPYQDVFTSGTILLALTFGLPVIAPDIPEIRQIIPKENLDLLYQGNRPRHVFMQMQRIIDMDQSELAERREACFNYARKVSPEIISGKLVGLIQQLIDQRKTA